MSKKTIDTFWVSNISNRNVSLYDLGLTIPAGKSVNLLDRKHYFFNKEELVSSAVSGSLFKKKDKIVVRKVPPVFESVVKLEVSTYSMPFKVRSTVQTTEQNYDELDISDEAFAEQNADLIDQYNK